jgi:hypothetical protein
MILADEYHCGGAASNLISAPQPTTRHADRYLARAPHLSP